MRMATKLKTPELSRVSAETFAEKWKSYTDEKQHARGFWSDFFTNLCGVDDQEEAGIEYEKRVKSTISGNQEYIDVYWKNVALIEHKTAGENLDKAELQARGYWLSLAPGYRPKTIIISDFHNFRIVDVALNKTHEFPLSKLPDNIHRFEAIISGNRTKISEEEITVDQQAAKLMANLYLELEAHGFEGHETSIFLVRLLFLLFGDDTGMWSKNLFLKLVMETKEDGADVGPTFDELFEVLNTAQSKRSESLSVKIKDFPYVNGNIFAEKISVIDFNKKMRKALVEVANYDWTTINPTIFGSLFQLIKNKEARRELGEHYTSEENINKIVYPLFLDGLQEQLAAAWDSKKELKKLRQALTKIKIFDPACGCGNFLVVSYRHLRQLELELIVRLRNLEGEKDALQLDGAMGLSVGLNQFYGIEIEEWPAQVAQMALFLTDHQENLKLEKITGITPNRFPLTSSAKITQGNALHLDWAELLEIDDSTFILGNPPFYGARMQSAEQKDDGKLVWGDIKGVGELDYVTNWYRKAADYLIKSKTNCAFVSTNSITQGEQPSIIWSILKPMGIKINFAHQTFRWGNDASGVAAVHCVIIGFSAFSTGEQISLWEYPDIDEDPVKVLVKNINAYLLNAPDILITARSEPLVGNIPEMDFGSMPNDGGFLSDIDEDTAIEIRKTDPIAGKYLRNIIGARELIHNEKRFCLWLVDADISEMRNSPTIKQRISEVKKLRSESKRAATNRLASTPHLFGEIRQPNTQYIVIGRVSSENREYFPISIMQKDVITNDAVLLIPTDDISLFAILISNVAALWMKAISGRLKSDIRISATITYNNFPFPKLLPKDKAAIESSGKLILATRANYPELSLADLYDPLHMPKDLRDAHKNNDKLILEIFGLKDSATNAEILEKLFYLYSELIEADKLK
jgi:type I restriction-modification system DNA methylase subunit